MRKCKRLPGGWNSPLLLFDGADSG